MKNLIVISILVFASLIAQAEILEVNQIDKTVYVHPSPVLDVELIDLEEEGGMLSISINYETQATTAELEQLQKDYVGLKVQPLMANVKPNQMVMLSIPEAGINETTKVAQGQFGPYVNFQKLISKAQTLKLKSLNKKINEKVIIEIEVSTNFSSHEELESYSASSDVCKTLGISNVKDMVLQFSKLQKPQEIKYKETFESLKENMLKECFVIDQKTIDSFKDLLNVRVFTSSASFLLKGEFIKKTDKIKNFALKPSAVLSIK